MKCCPEELYQEGLITYFYHESINKLTLASDDKAQQNPYAHRGSLLQHLQMLPVGSCHNIYNRVKIRISIAN